MKRIDINDKEYLNPIRLYFSRLDKNYISKLSEEDKKIVELELKLYLLLKGQLIVAASDLFTESGAEFFKDKEIFLEEGLIVPALRDKFKNIDDFVQEKYNGKFPYKSFFENNVKFVLSWSLEENSNWFRDALYTNILYDGSLLNRNLKLHNGKKRKIIEEIYLENYKDRGYEFYNFSLIERAKHVLSKEEYDYFYKFARYIYYLSGARVVGGESLIPQRNLINEPIEKLQIDKDREYPFLQLSDIDIFIDLFTTAFIESLYVDLKKIFNRQFIENISNQELKNTIFLIRAQIGKDVKILKEKIREFIIKFYLEKLYELSPHQIVKLKNTAGDEFLKKFYNTIENTIISTGGKSYFYDFEKIVEIHSKLKERVKDIVNEEFLTYYKKQNLVNRINTKIKSTTDVFLNFAFSNASPNASPLASVVIQKVADKSFDILTNVTIDPYSTNNKNVRNLVEILSRDIRNISKKEDFEIINFISKLINESVW